MEKEFSFFFDWKKFTGMEERELAEFAENGAKNIVVTNDLLERFLNEPTFFYLFCKLMEKHHLKFQGCHGLWSGVKDLNCDDRQYREISIANHKRAMGYAADAGCKEYVVHIGALCCYYRPYDEQKMRDYACDTLEKLIPEAEKLGIIIAVENSQEGTNTAAEVMKIVNVFGDDPHVGLCYDTGHANCMASAPGKDKNKYEPYFPVCWWENGVEWEDGAIQLLKEKIVTCHIHDNNGYGDLHGMPFDGTINWKELMRAIKNQKVSYKELSKYPAVKRDLALLIDKAVQFADIEKIAYESEKKLLKEVALFDVYEGKNLEAGKKSYAVSFLLQDENATLNDKQIDKIMSKIIANLENKLQAKLR